MPKADHTHKMQDRRHTTTTTTTRSTHILIPTASAEPLLSRATIGVEGIMRDMLDISLGVPASCGEEVEEGKREGIGGEEKR